MSGQILVVDDLLLSRMVLRVKLSAACYQVGLAATGADALAQAREGLPDLVLLDCNLPDLSGLDVCRQLRTDPRTRHIPIILFSADQSRALRLKALAAGADDFLSKPMDETFLLSRISALLRHTISEKDYQLHATPSLRHGMAEAQAHFQGPARIALVGGTPMQPEAEKTCEIDHRNFDVTMPISALLAPTPATRMPDVLLLSPDVVEQRGLHVVAELRARHGTSRLPIAVLLSDDSRISPATLLDMGAEEVLTLPVDNEEFRLRMAAMVRRKNRQDALRRALGVELDMAARDSLTGLFNRRHAMSRLSDILAGTPGVQRPCFGILMIDLDNFKQINDHFGHLAGDEVLTEVGRRMQKVTRPDDVLARYGGEEFIMILPGADRAETQRLAEAIRREIEGQLFQLTEGGFEIPVTASIGMTVQPDGRGDASRTTLEQIRDIIEQADKALWMAKSAGRNRVSVCNSAVA